MFAALIISASLAISADPTERVSSFSDGALQITGKQLSTSMPKSETPRASSSWKCQADGNATLRFGDIEARADAINVAQVDGNRYTFLLTGNVALRIRGLTANAAEISWSTDDRPMVLKGNARITLEVDGEPTSVTGETIVFDHADKTLKLPGDAPKRVPAPKKN